MNRKQSQDDIKLKKKHMIAFICNGKSDLSRQENLLNDEINWLNANSNSGFDGSRAILINQADNASGNIADSMVVEPHLMLQSNPERQAGNPAQNVFKNYGVSLKRLQNPKICLACSANKNQERKSKTYPPYTYFYKPLNLCFSIMIDNEPDDINQLFRISGFIEWLGIYSPKLLFSKDSNNSEYLFYWLIYCIVNTDNDVLSGLYNGLNSLSTYNIGGLFNIFFTDGSGVYTYSNKDENHNESKTIFFKINRDEHNVCNYVLRNSDDQVDYDWIHLKPNSLYYFPTSGELGSSLNITSPYPIDEKPANSNLRKYPSLFFEAFSRLHSLTLGR